MNYLCIIFKAFVGFRGPRPQAPTRASFIAPVGGTKAPDPLICSPLGKKSRGRSGVDRQELRHSISPLPHSSLFLGFWSFSITLLSHPNVAQIKGSAINDQDNGICGE